jgi:hypothetical protein
MGYNAGEYITSCTYSVAVGYKAMLGVFATPLTGNANVALGDSALYQAQSTAGSNTALGYQSLYSAATDPKSTAVGYQALYSQAGTTTPNTAVGYQAGEYITSGNGNTAVGYWAMLGVSATPLTCTDNGSRLPGCLESDHQCLPRARTSGGLQYCQRRLNVDPPCAVGGVNP